MSVEFDVDLIFVSEEWSIIISALVRSIFNFRCIVMQINFVMSDF